VDNRTESDHQLLMLYKISRSSAWMAFFTLVIAAGISACAYLFWQQLSAMQNVLDDLDDLSGKIQKSLDVGNEQSVAIAKAMKFIGEQVKSNTATTEALARGVEKLRGLENAGQMTKLDRPWVGVGRLSFSPLLDSQPFTITVAIRNSGRSPATDVRMTFSTSIPAANAVVVPQIQACKDCVRSILLPNAATTQELRIDATELSPEKIGRIKAGADKILLFGRVDYSDTADGAHTTAVCMSYDPEINKFRACLSGNRFN
jgi:hypothetical protein